MEGPNHGGSELTGSSDDGRLSSDSKMVMKKEVKLIVISTSGEDIEDLIRKVVREEVPTALQKFTTDKDWNNELAITTSAGRSLQLKFLDEVSLLVLTGEELNGKGGAAIRLAVVDKMTGQLVASGPGASAKVEILILQANDHEDELNWSIEEFNKRIIIGSNEGSLIFPKKWARVVDNVSGIMVKEAWTESFMVRDRRIEIYKKKKTPSLSDKVWRLCNISRGGKIDQRLQREKIYIVEDFLIRLLKDYNGLKIIVHLGEKRWEDMVKNARACPSGNRMYCYKNSLQNTAVVYNIHGEIIGLYSESQYAATQMLSEKNKVVARELFSSAIDHWEDIIRFDDESSLQQHLTSLRAPVDQLDSLEPGYSVGPHNAVTSETFGAHLDTSLPGTISNMIPTQDIDLEYFDPPFSIDDVPIMSDWGFELVPSSNLNAETMFSGVTTLINEINVEAGIGEMDFMLAVPNSKALHRWKMLFSVSRFFSVRKMVASEGDRAQKRLKVC